MRKRKFKSVIVAVKAKKALKKKRINESADTEWQIVISPGEVHGSRRKITINHETQPTTETAKRIKRYFL